MLVGDMDWYIWHSFLSLVISLVVQALFQWIQWHLLIKQCKQRVLLSRHVQPIHYHQRRTILAASFFSPLEGVSCILWTYGGHCHAFLRAMKNDTNFRFMDGFLYKKEAIWWHQDIGSSYGCHCHVPFQCFIRETAISNWCHH
ncbi:hypothetical protein K492DRAFT_8420 [Lichtheimia hyalospora FSU 10163]|nr:hypothetical protein K492DRAFT_8420 [Lichtheimia hyalospora FSU 10163]